MIQKNLAPIVLFTYNRLWHTQQTVEALQKNELAKESELFIFSDGGKDEASWQKVNELREYLKTISGFKNITLTFQDENKGLANSIINGVTKIVNEYGKIIVLEDDLLTSPYFLKYMNEALEFYKDEKSVYSITGYSFSNNISNIDSSYFLKLTSSWSWATWASKWKEFKREKQDLEDFINNKEEKKEFNFDGSYDSVSMAKKQLENKIDSWAIYWYFSVFKLGGLTLYPAKSLVENIGFDSSGTHCGNSVVKREFDCSFYPILTTNIEEKKENRAAIANVLKSENPKLIQKIKNRLKKYLSAKQKHSILMIISKIKLFFYKKDIGKGSYIDKTVNVFGWSYVKIGENTLIGEQTWLNVNGRIKNHKHIEIGNHCYLGRRNLLVSSKKLIIGDYVMTSNDCKFLGSNHIYSNPLEPYIATGTMDDDTLKIGANVWVGAGAIVLGAVTVGHGSILGAGSVVTKDIPPFSVAVGNPCKVVKRFNFKTDQWDRIEIFDKSLEALMPNEEEYLKILKSNKLTINMPVMAATSRYGDLF